MPEQEHESVPIAPHDRAAVEYPLQAPADALTAAADVAGPPRGTFARLTTFESFRHRDFSYAFAGALVSNIGSWMQMMALGWVVYDLTGSESSLGFMNALGGLPVTFLALFAGAAAERFDRRKLLIWVQVLLMAQALAFGLLNYTGHITMAWIYALILGGGVVQAFMAPAWQAMTPDLVPRSSLMNAVALNSAQFNAARLVGPMVGGIVFATLGVTEVFFVNAASFVFVIVALAVIRPRQVRHASNGESGWQLLTGGVRYAMERRRVRMLLASIAIVTVFGMPFTALLPAIARKTLGLDETGYSFLMSANGLGALAGALVIASLSQRIARERVISWGLLAMALGIFGLAAARTQTVAIAVLVPMGFVFLASVSSINTSLQMTCPPEVRGRVMSLFVLAFMGMMPIGAAIFGPIAERTSPSVAIAIGGGVLLAYALLLLARPALLCEDDDERCRNAAPARAQVR
jgi:predicted MFS family arabinose efflux permease